MRLSVVVPAYNEERLIDGSLRAIQEACRACRRVGWEIEVVVCDNNSTDQTAARARAAGARVVFEPVNQISRARNTGAAAARGEWLVFVDADSYPSEALFEDLVRAIQSGGVVGGGCTVELEGVRGTAWLLNRVWNGLSRVNRWAAGSFIFVETAVFRELGGFSTELFASEELDWSARLGQWARRHQRSVVILSGNPLRTSGRKVDRMQGWEGFRMLWATVWSRGGNLRTREGCAYWYDGRR